MKISITGQAAGVVFHRTFKAVVALQVQFGEKSQRKLNKSKISGKSAVWREELILCVLLSGRCQSALVAGGRTDVSQIVEQCLLSEILLGADYRDICPQSPLDIQLELWIIGMVNKCKVPT